MTIEFVHGCEIEELEGYFKRIGLLFGETERRLITENPDRLIVWRENGTIIGHTIWHSSNTHVHPDGTPRELDDRHILEDELGVEGDFIELHEIWLSEETRGKGYGKQFFDYFENMVRQKGYPSIVYYADHPAAMSICRRRGYKEAHGVEFNGITGQRSTFYVLSLTL